MREARRRSRLGKSPGPTPATSRRYITMRASSNDRYIDASRRPPGSSRRCFEGEVRNAPTRKRRILGTSNKWIMAQLRPLCRPRKMVSKRVEV
ncbi:hypothetical protein RB213_014941 [Colletotrichum asianum]